MFTQACTPDALSGKPVPAKVELNASVTRDADGPMQIDVHVYRTYAAESPVADGHVVVLVPPDQSPVCTVADAP
jgi:hypothetical protein